MQKHNQFSENTRGVTVLLLFLMTEGLVRLFLQPDPWLLHPTHWYFNQPSRLLIEVSIVVMLLLIIKRYMNDLLRVPKSHRRLFIVATLISVSLFALLEFDQLISSLNGELSHIMTWLVVGFCIGLGQELLYRGMLYTSLLNYLSATQAKTLTTTVFVVAPLHSIRLWDLYLQNQLMVVGLLIMIYLSASIFFQWLRDKTGSVMVPGVVHGMGNAITWLAVFS